MVVPKAPSIAEQGVFWLEQRDKETAKTRNVPGLRYFDRGPDSELLLFDRHNRLNDAVG